MKRNRARRAIFLNAFSPWVTTEYINSSAEVVVADIDEQQPASTQCTELPEEAEERRRTKCVSNVDGILPLRYIYFPQKIDGFPHSFGCFDAAEMKYAINGDETMFAFIIFAFNHDWYSQNGWFYIVCVRALAFNMIFSLWHSSNAQWSNR